MITRAYKTVKKFYSYQQKRFPLIVLALSLSPAILSSGAIISVHPSIFHMGSALVASIAYLLHIRIIDEHRDFDHDNVHHATRPVQAGTISKEELHHIDISAVALLVLIAASAGSQAFATAVVMLSYSYLAGKEFFVGEKIRRYFFSYNAANLIQMFLMQIFVYTIFANPFPFNTLILAHFIFTSVGTVIFEFVRKLKIPGDDGSGRDTYTWYLGFYKAIAIYQVLLVSDTLLFIWIATLLLPHTAVLLSFALGLAMLASLSTLIHTRKKTHQTDQLMQLSFLLLYGIFNLAIYFLKII